MFLISKKHESCGVSLQGGNAHYYCDVAQASKPIAKFGSSSILIVIDSKIRKTLLSKLYSIWLPICNLVERVIVLDDNIVSSLPEISRFYLLLYLQYISNLPRDFYPHEIKICFGEQSFPMHRFGRASNYMRRVIAQFFS